MATKTITLRKINTGDETDNYSIYHTSVSAPNLIESGVSKTRLEMGVQYSVDVSLYNFVVVSTGICTTQTSITITSSDLTAPTNVATISSGTITGNSIVLNWTAATDAHSGIKGYVIYNSAGTLLYTLGNVLTYTASGLASATSYTYKVKAYDYSPNPNYSSSFSNTLSVSTLDVTIPSTPTNLIASSITATTFTLSWTASTDNVGIGGYEIYKNGGLYISQAGTGVSIAITGQTASAINTWTVYAYDTSNNLSLVSAGKVVTQTAGATTLPNRTIANLRHKGVEVSLDDACYYSGYVYFTGYYQSNNAAWPPNSGDLFYTDNTYTTLLGTIDVTVDCLTGFHVINGVIGVGYGLY